MNGVRYIFQKEVTRVFKDKKMVLSLFVMPVVLIVGMYYLMGTMITKAEEDVDKHISTVCIQNAPEDFKALLDAADEEEAGKITWMSKDDSLDNVKDDILEGNTDLLIVFPEDFSNAVINFAQSADIPQVKTYYNPSEDYSAAAREMYVTGFLEGYKQVLLTQRVGNLDSLTVFTVDSDNEDMVIQDDEKATGKMLGNLLPYFVTLILFAGVMSLGIDTITGEKERGTMASLLITPLKRNSIVMGKILSLMVMSVLSAAAYLIAMVAAMPIITKSMGGSEVMESLSIKFSAVQIIQLAVILAVVVFLYVALVSAVAVFARTVKEGSTYIMPVYIAVLAVGMVTMFASKEASTISYCIPIYNAPIALRDLLAQELSIAGFALTVVSTLAAGGIVSAVIVKAFNSEKVMFNA